MYHQPMALPNVPEICLKSVTRRENRESCKGATYRRQFHFRLYYGEVYRDEELSI